ncbi:RmlC-like cupin domain-containing protein [Aspergillus caelatus]|uniref:Mannose-6-phosphate isomerase n=1 Tax=Aspergillus caelatus TaxID=61420 RepID=A0A5N6ZZM6_9EURO|nr:RmlC-like cupin domain-containing protein [Aspergillus caelatus]KAE8363061.1 RmlC-like cupin domain-containing protein [Aspergillus caelatus]
MANIVQRPLNRFRKSESYKPLHERFGDVAISAPTEGSWNQLENPRHSSPRGYGHGLARGNSTRSSRENYDTASAPQNTAASRQNSFSISTLNPRRLSMRLAPRSRHSTEDPNEKEHLHHNDRRTEFAYKPIHQDYSTEVAEKAASRVHDSPRFRYIPADARTAAISPGSHRYSTSSQHSTQSNYAGIEDRDNRPRRQQWDSRYEDKYDHHVEPLERSHRSSRTGYRTSGEYSEWAMAAQMNASSSSEKKRLRAAKRMTMTMNDSWGKQGKNSLAGQLWSKTPKNGDVKDDQTYSEMWMGTYPAVPSRILSTGELLSEYLKKNPELVGKSALDKYGPEIPFLPKILSFRKALPLQVHPDKSLAEQLHKENPDQFNDPNHKPEIAVALSNFELFAGFKPLSEIEAIMKLKPVEQLVPSNQPFDDELLRELCKTLLTLPPIVVSEIIQSLKDLPEAQFGKHRYIPGMLNRLSKQYTEFDNGNLVAALLMNYMTLGPGEAVCVPADSIHAYLCGDIVECMARSDNVINTGFCPRAERDNIDLFTRALTFKPHGVDEALLPRRKSDKGVSGKSDEYAPPFSEFNVLATSLGAGEHETHKAISGPSLLFVTKGCGRLELSEGKSVKTFDLQVGYVYFVGQGVSLDLSTDKGMAVYRPYAE